MLSYDAIIDKFNHAFSLQKCIRYNICAAKLHNFFHVSIEIIRKLFNILTI